ncbi:MAG: hypothetical protein AVDCRST_MAG49-83 [uncultured Thermomicrobiales bacterium]|uniref:Uncharacterized protein n=1 Tax=uncultured Thermomicrobiales bacterium TaxID=1645740 RepID=A0A6J4TVY9_9BACT|nr:MAG: hypothetical protein AVDCRST_MAG49-83 [uncultured Thermomicrobiales bacterium]
MRRIILAAYGPPTGREAAHVLDAAGATVAVVAEPTDPPPTAEFRDAVVGAVAGDLGAEVAGVAFTARLGGGAVGFT